MAIPVLEPIDLTGKTITADALLTQRKLATYLVERDAHYLFIAKDNQPTPLVYSRSTATTGASRPITPSSTGTGTRIAAPCAPATDRRILPACDASPSG